MTNHQPNTKRNAMTDTIIATLNKAGVRNISTDLWGIFYEDISYSGDG